MQKKDSRTQDPETDKQEQPFSERFSEAATEFFEVVREDFITAIEWVFATTYYGGARRRLIILFTCGALWGISAYLITPITSLGGEEAINAHLYVYPFYALFKPEMFRHVLVAGFTFWIALQLAANYLDDVFELNKIELSEKYIIQSALGSEYKGITINNGEITPEDKDSTVARIGGPGKVKVTFNNVALFEDYKGVPRTIGPEKDDTMLERFERLRSVLPLKDQTSSNIMVKARTRGGIQVIAKGVRAKYSIYREDKIPSLEVPYPYSKDAVQNLVYYQPNFIALTCENEEPPSDMTKSTERFNLSDGFIRTEIEKFITKSTLSDFLAAKGRPEEENEERQKEQIRTEKNKISPSDSVDSTAQTQESSKEPFIYRDEITREIYENLKKRAAKMGVQLYWLDIGTWELPKDAAKIPEQHKEAWRISLENKERRSAPTQEQLKNKWQVEAMKSILQDILFAFDPSKKQKTSLKKEEMDAFELLNLKESKNIRRTPEQIVKEIALVFRQKISSAIEVSKQIDDIGDTPESLEKTISHLRELAGEYNIFRGNE